MEIVHLRPLTGQIHVRPDPSPTHSDGGIVIPDAYRDMPPMSGTVIAVGPPDLDTQRKVTAIRARAIRDCLAAVEHVSETFRYTAELQVVREDIAGILRCEPTPEPGVQVGDRVVFPYTAGCDVVLGENADGRTIILRERDVIAKVEVEAVAA